MGQNVDISLIYLIDIITCGFLLLWLWRKLNKTMIIIGNLKIYWYWDTYAFSIYFKYQPENYRMKPKGFRFRYIPKFHKFSKDRRMLLIQRI